MIFLSILRGEDQRVWAFFCVIVISETESSGFHQFSFFLLQCAFTLLARAEMSGHTGGTETRSLHRVLGNILEFDVLSLEIALHDG